MGTRMAYVQFVVIALLLVSCGAPVDQTRVTSSSESAAAGSMGPASDDEEAGDEAPNPAPGNGDDSATSSPVTSADPDVGTEDLTDEERERQEEYRLGMIPDPIVLMYLWPEVFGTVEDMTAAADAIVIGTVVGFAPDVSDGSDTIYRDVRVRVDDSLTGDAVGDQELRMRQVDRHAVLGSRLEVEDLTRFEDGDEVMLFLISEPEWDGIWEPINHQGAHRIVDGVLEVSDREDALIRELEGSRVDALANRVIDVMSD